MTVTGRGRPRLDGTMLLVAAWSLCAVGVSLNRGDWEISALVCLILGFALACVVAWRRLPVRQPNRRELALAVLVCLVAALAHPVGASMQLTDGRLFTLQAVAAAAAGTAVIGLLAWPRWQRLWLLVTVAATVAVGSLVIGLVPHPDIDVWAILQQSSTGLVHGDDMYQQHWVDGFGLKAVYPYLPWTTVFVTPFRLVFGDARVAMLAFLLAGAYLLRRMAPAAPAALAALVLVSPHVAYYLVRSWTEPELMVLLFAALLLIDCSRPGWAMLAVGAALACKQPVVLLLPAFAIWPSFGWRRTLGSVVIAAVAVAPWFVADPAAFWHDAVDAELGLGTLPRALSVPSGLAHAGVHVGFWLLVLTLVGVYALILRRLPRTTAGLAIGCALVLYGYDLANTQSFFNHYQLAAELLLASLALSRTSGPVTRS